jgi:hypothetical protein
MARTVGIVLIVIGLIGLVWGGINYTTRETVVDLGPIEATKETNRRIPVTPLAGAVALIGGIALLMGAGRTTRGV